MLYANIIHMTQPRNPNVLELPYKREKPTRNINPTILKQLGGVVLSGALLATALFPRTAREGVANIKEQLVPTNAYELVDDVVPYEVQRKDTLLRIAASVGDVLEGNGSAIALNTHATAYEIAKINDIANRNKIEAGDVLLLPADIADVELRNN